MFLSRLKDIIVQNTEMKKTTTERICIQLETKDIISTSDGGNSYKLTDIGLQIVDKLFNNR